MFWVRIWSELGDDAGCNEDGDSNGLPEGKEENSFDAEEFRDRSVYNVNLRSWRTKTTRTERASSRH
jgi:hypothetical protein